VSGGDLRPSDCSCIFPRTSDCNGLLAWKIYLIPLNGVNILLIFACKRIAELFNFLRRVSNYWAAVF